ncbi:MAG: helix-turn-helix domain-containing protein [Woeseiaceae bacterium]|nr:helix-turn-helix domain-containing protein [Woeseiaceae bacterium]
MRPEDFVASYFDAWNHRDPQAVADHLAAGGVYCDVPEHARHSHDELIAYLENFFSSDVNRYRLVGDVVANERTIAFQYEIVPLEPERAPCESLRGAEFITLKRDAASTIVDYYDVQAHDSRSRMADVPVSAGGKYAKSGLGDARLEALQSRLERRMQSERLYLRQDLSLPVLAREMGCSVNHLSQVINAGFGMSFFDYLNSYRIAYAKELLSRPEDRDVPILRIAFSSGFNSNSAFYAAFRKRVGRTPAQYRSERCSSPS